jgi:hypothetical protein
VTSRRLVASAIQWIMNVDDGSWKHITGTLARGGLV